MPSPLGRQVPVKAVAVDIDGTMTDYRRLLDLEGVKAVRKVERKGIPVIPVTGNVMPVTKSFANFVGTSGPLVCENGGVVYSNDLKRKKILFSRARGDAAVQHLKELGFKIKPIWSDAWRVSEVALSLDLDEAEVKKALAHTGLDIVSTRFALHIMEPGLDKMHGLMVGLRFIPGNIRIKDVLAIGDSNNDRGILSGCGYSGCVRNGSTTARAAAQIVARKDHGAGVAEILRHFGVL